MKALLCLFLSVATAAFATNVGDTYQQVIAEKGNPKSQIEAGTMRILKYTDVTITVRDNVVTSIKAVVSPPPDNSPPPSKPVPADAFAPPSREAQILAIKKERLNAIATVQRIVNQNPTAKPIDSSMNVTKVSGWFRAEYGQPDFNADVRKTQKLDYERFEYVGCDLNPGVAFPGDDLESNIMLKAFYTDLTIPKKRLSESEMLQINKLFKVIGQCEDQLNKMFGKKPAAEAAPR